MNNRHPIPAAMEGKATRRQVAISFRLSGETYTFHLTLFVPNQRTAPAPVFLLLNHRATEHADPTRQKCCDYWPAEEVLMHRQLRNSRRKLPQSEVSFIQCIPDIKKCPLPNLLLKTIHLMLPSMITHRKADERGHAVHGWLDSWHTFSFSSYYDPAWMGFRSLRVINDDRIEPGHGFGTHGHSDMEIITYLIRGELEHKDSLGNGRIIRPGEVQYMSAGSGVRHSEFNPSKTTPCHLLQIWIEPDQKGGAPRYADRSLGAVPSGQLQLIASKAGRAGSFAIHQDADLWLAKLEPGDCTTHLLATGRHAWIHVAEGDVTLNGELLSAGDAAAVSDETSLSLVASKPSQVLLFDLS